MPDANPRAPRPPRPPDEVDEASDESFPASDPPSTQPLHPGGPAKKPAPERPAGAPPRSGS